MSMYDSDDNRYGRYDRDRYTQENDEVDEFGRDKQIAKQYRSKEEKKRKRSPSSSDSREASPTPRRNRRRNSRERSKSPYHRDSRDRYMSGGYDYDQRMPPRQGGYPPSFPPREYLPYPPPVFPNYGGEYPYESGGRNSASSDRYQKKRERRESPSSEEDYRKFKKQRTAYKQPPVEEKPMDVKSRLNALITKLGDTTPQQIEHQLEQLYDVLVDDLKTEKELIVDLVINCAMELSTKTPVYGTLVGLINSKNPQFGADIVAHLVKQLEKKLKCGDWMRAKLLVRFACELLNANVVYHKDVVTMLNSIMQQVFSSKYQNQPLIQESYAYIVIASLPWAGRVLEDRKREDLSKLMASLEKYISDRKSKYSSSIALKSVNLRKHPSSDKGDYIDSMWSQIKTCQKEGWRVTSILKPYLDFESKLLNKSVTQHVMFPSGEFIIPEIDTNQQFARIFKGNLGLYDEEASDSEDEEDFETISPIDTFVIEEYICDIIYFFNSSHLECVQHLINLPVRFSYEHVLVDIIFSHMLLLPNPPFRIIYYGLLLLDISKSERHNTYVPMIAKWIDLLYERVEKMDMEVFERYAEWFAFHMSNFELKWGWESWKTVSHQSKTSKKYLFVQEVMMRISKITGIEKLKLLIPNYLEPMMPPTPAPYYKFAELNKSYGKEAEVILDAIKSKKDVQIISQLLKETLTASDRTKVDILTNTILLAGSESPSHLAELLDIYKPVYNVYLETENRKAKQSMQLSIVKSIAGFWVNSVQILQLALDKYIKASILDFASVTNWALRKSQVGSIPKCYWWQLIRYTIEGCLARTRGYLYEIERDQKLLSHLPADMEAMQKEIESSAKTQETATTSAPETKENESTTTHATASETNSGQNSSTQAEGSAGEPERPLREKKPLTPSERLKRAQEQTATLQAHIPEQEKLYLQSCNELKELLVFIARRMCKLIVHYKKTKEDDVWAHHLTEHWKEFCRKYQKYVVSDRKSTLESVLRVSPLPTALAQFIQIFDDSKYFLDFGTFFVEGRQGSRYNNSTVRMDLRIIEELKSIVVQSLSSGSRRRQKREDDDEEDEEEVNASTLDDITDDEADKQEEEEPVKAKPAPAAATIKEEEEDEMKIADE